MAVSQSSVESLVAQWLAAVSQFQISPFELLPLLQQLPPKTAPVSVFSISVAGLDSSNDVITLEVTGENIASDPLSFFDALDPLGAIKSKLAGSITGISLRKNGVDLAPSVKLQPTDFSLIAETVYLDLTDQDLVIGQPTVDFLASRLLLEPELPVISLAVSSKLIREDGSSRLVYTFSRTGDLSSGLEVSYAVSGAASIVRTAAGPADYKIVGSNSTASVRSVVFAPGSATAVVQVDPIADIRPESNEAVGFKLIPGSAYSVGTAVVVKSSIVNDDVVSSVSTTLKGSQSSLRLTGTSAINGRGNSLNNTIIGNSARNTLTGANGNDLLRGGGGRDVLIGIALSDAGLGGGSVDVLTGGFDNDRFVLGNKSGAFYVKPGAGSPGRIDYARVSDFSAGDRIQLHGSPSDYVLKTGDKVSRFSGVGLYLNDGVGAGASDAGWDRYDELIGLIQAKPGVSLDLANLAQFSYLSA